MSSDGNTGTHDQNVLLAATLIKDAAASRNMTFRTDERSIRLYNLYNHIAFKLALYVGVWCLLFLAVFERPAVPGAALPYWATMIIEFIILVFFLCRFLHNVLFAEQASFWKDPKNIVVIVTIILIAVDMLGYIVWVNVASPEVAAKAIRWSRPLRPLFLVNFPEGRQLRKAFRNILRTLPDVGHILALFLASIAIFALLALKLIQNRSLEYPDGRLYFNNYFECVWDLYVLVTTANSPDVMMPAYNKNNWFAMFFFVYVVVNVYIFMNIVLASVYNNYKRHLKNEVIKTVYLKRRLLERVFDMMKVWQNDTYVVTKKTWHTLMRTAAPHWGPTRRDVLFYVLDDTADNAIRKKDFLKVADLLNVELAEVKEEPTVLEKFCPGCYLSAPSEIIKSIVRHRFFHYTFDFLILLNAFIVGFNLEEAEWGFLAAFTVEILLRLYTFGPKKYFTTFWDIFDFCVVMPAVVGTVVETSLGDEYGRMKLVDFLMVIRVLKLVRLIGSIKRFQIVLTTIVNIGPSIVTYEDFPEMLNWVQVWALGQPVQDLYTRGLQVITHSPLFVARGIVLLEDKCLPLTIEQREASGF
ncbi:Two pore calcium channel protein 1A [Lamellibrachia satsuma]|nr:Two pore calcium channel protein 1A [Lamellibrachia satsuma]